ncbi:MAG: trehalose-phosphatase [bacterium]
MKSLIENENIDDVLDTFFANLSKAKYPLLLLDYDGTLAPFVEDRDKALPYPSVVPIIEDIQRETRTKVVIISGRAVNNLLDLLRMDPIPELWGSHGLERLRSHSDYQKMELSLRELEILVAAEETAAEYIDENRIEKKPAGVAAHFRGKSDEDAKQLARSIRKAWVNIIGETNFEIHDFDGGIELRLAYVNKGLAVRELFKDNVDYFGTYLGDDHTDEDAFKALSDGNLPVLVRPEYRKTSANIWIRPPEELKQFLNKWLSTLS